MKVCKICEEEIVDNRYTTEDWLGTPLYYHLECSVQMMLMMTQNENARNLFVYITNIIAGENRAISAPTTMIMALLGIVSQIESQDAVDDKMAANASPWLDLPSMELIETEVEEDEKRQAVDTLKTQAMQDLTRGMLVNALRQILPQEEVEQLLLSALALDGHVVHMLTPLLNDNDPANWFAAIPLELLHESQRRNDELHKMSVDIAAVIPVEYAVDIKETAWATIEPDEAFARLRQSPYYSAGVLLTVTLGSLIEYQSDIVPEFVQSIHGDEFYNWYKFYLFSLERFTVSVNQMIEEGIDRQD